MKKREEKNYNYGEDMEGGKLGRKKWEVCITNGFPKFNDQSLEYSKGNGRSRFGKVA